MSGKSSPPWAAHDVTQEPTGGTLNSAKVLHVVESLDRGAVENWLLRCLRHARQTNVAAEWTFYCALGVKGRLDDEVRSLGARVVYSPVPLRQIAGFVRALRAELRHGRYDVLHCHHDLVSGVYLLSALGLPIRKTLVHVHNADEIVPTSSTLKRLIVKPLLRRICLQLADTIVGISRHTLATFVDGRTLPVRKGCVHYYGVDPTAFKGASIAREAVRRTLRIPEHAPVLLFAGRMVPEKNPLFAVEVLAELRELVPDAIGIFAGAGALESEVRTRAQSLGLDGAFLYLGWRADIASIMCASDLFILPHPEIPMEGFGLAVAEAQLAGLHLLLSRGVPDDPLLPSASFRRISMSATPQTWARAGAYLLTQPAPSCETALAELGNSPMDMDTALSGLMRLHR
jgi:glycosyltransferase involved in cell wall biosynthesis